MWMQDLIFCVCRSLETVLSIRKMIELVEYCKLHRKYLLGFWTHYMILKSPWNYLLFFFLVSVLWWWGFDEHYKTCAIAFVAWSTIWCLPLLLWWFYRFWSALAILHMHVLPYSVRNRWLYCKSSFFSANQALAFNLGTLESWKFFASHVVL